LLYPKPPLCLRRAQFARNPAQAIKQAIRDQAAATGKSPRILWRVLCDSAAPGGSDYSTATLNLEPFSAALKHLGTGVQLEACDVEVAFGWVFNPCGPQSTPSCFFFIKDWKRDPCLPRAPLFLTFFCASARRSDEPINFTSFSAFLSE